MDNLKAICFDMGDTLAEMSPAIHECGHGMFRDFGLSCTVADARDALVRAWMTMGDVYMGIGGEPSSGFWPRFLECWLGEMGVGEDCLQLAERMAEGFRGVDWQGSLLEEAPSLLEALRARGYRLAIISNWDSGLEAYCQELGIAQHFTCILASQAVGISKPHRRIFEMALERLGVAPSEAVHVGDNYYADVLGAQRVGMHGILVDGHSYFPRAECHRLTELGELLAVF